MPFNFQYGLPLDAVAELAAEEQAAKMANAGTARTQSGGGDRRERRGGSEWLARERSWAQNMNERTEAIGQQILQDRKETMDRVVGGVLEQQQAAEEQAWQEGALSRADQHKMLNATKDVEAIQQAWRTNQIDEQQYAKALQATEAEYGENVLTHVPSYMEAVGKQGQLQQAKVEAMKGYAAHHEIDEKFVRWNEQTNSPALDPVAVDIEQFKTEKQEAEVTNLDKVWTNRRKDVEAKANIVGQQMQVVAAKIEALQTAGQKQTPGLTRLYNQHAQEMYSLLGQLKNEEERPSLASADEPATKVPLKSMTRQEAEAAVRSGQLTKDSKPIVIDGVVAKYNGRKFERVGR